PCLVIGIGKMTVFVGYLSCRVAHKTSISRNGEAVKTLKCNPSVLNGNNPSTAFTNIGLRRVRP
ncbi:MAG: hypothetical protein LBR96_06620, partial [Treponema sp.]|nr:hypothetical protein [Treponema sp.]